MSGLTSYRPEPRDTWERRMTGKHGLPPYFARTHADLRNGKSD